MMILLGALIGSAAVAQGRPVTADRVDAFIRRTLQIKEYKRADIDLNRDGRPEALVYVTDRDYCGSGGCTFYVLTKQGRSYRTVMRSTVTQLPIRLLPTSSRGWRDIGVTVSGGGVARPYLARMRFNGTRYPANPSVQPPLPAGQNRGRVVID